MGKPPKQFHEGYWYHVYARSLEEVRLFRSDDEREWFIDKLDEVFLRRNVGLGALCLMDTHYHALVKMRSVRLDNALNGLHMSYAKHINEERGRRGSVFEKHPGTDIVLDESYLLQLIPYIHKNPVEAGIVSKPGNYPWHTDTMYRIGKWDQGPLKSWEWPPHFKDDHRERVYKQRMGEENEVPRSDKGYIGRSEEWTRLEKRDEERSKRHRDRRDRPTKDEIATQLVRDRETSVEALKEPGRKQPEVTLRQKAMVRMYEEGYGPKEIGDYFKRSKGTVWYAVNKFGAD